MISDLRANTASEYLVKMSYVYTSTTSGTDGSRILHTLRLAPSINI
jgi:hypothetical protein